MRFINTYRFSPVANKIDLPSKSDLFHKKWEEVPDTEEKYRDYVRKNNIRIDKGWWERMFKYLDEGIYIENAIEKGGDNFIDGVDAIWHGNDVYLPDYDYWILNKTIHITGRQFFYLNFWHIKRVDEVLKRKLVLNPKFTDLSWENYLIRHLADEQEKDILWTKSRQKGFSEEESSELSYDFTFYKESQSLIISGQEKYAKNTFNFAKRGLRRLINTQLFKWTSKNNDEEYISKYTGSEIIMRTVKDNAQAASSLSPSRVLYEEIGIWRKGLLTETAEFIKASQEAEGMKTSKNRFTGTGGEVDSGVDDMQDMFSDPASHNLYAVKNKYSTTAEGSGKVAIFIPATKFEIIDKDGNSLIELSRKKIEKDRASKSEKKRYRAITQKPFNPEELFSANPNGFFGQNIILWASQRKAYLLTHKEAIRELRGRLEWKHDIKNWKAGVEFIEDPDGDVVIIEPPRTYATVDENNKTVTKVYPIYKGGIDSYDQDEAKTSTSKGSAYIKKGFLNANDTYNKYVAYVTQRPELSEGGREVFYENTVKLMVLYGCDTLIEHTKILIFSWYTENGFMMKLKERPKAVIASRVTDSKTTNHFGLDGSFVPHALKMQRDYWAVKANVENIDTPHICDTIIKFKLDKNYNCDDTIAMTLCTVSMEEEKELLLKKEKRVEENFEQPTVYYKTVNGRVTLVTR